MWKNNRPDDWEKIKAKIADELEYEPSLTFENRIFEAGADAMLAWLRKESVRIKSADGWVYLGDIKGFDVAFIPEEEK